MDLELRNPLRDNMKFGSTRTASRYLGNEAGAGPGGSKPSTRRELLRGKHEVKLWETKWEAKDFVFPQTYL